MMNRMQLLWAGSIKSRLCALPILLSLTLTAVMILSLGACSSIQAEDTPPPHLVDLIEFPTGGRGAGVSKSVLHPNGTVYVIYSSNVAIISGTELVQLVPIPGPDGKIPDPLSSDYPQLSDITLDGNAEQIYVTDQRNNLVHVISGTEVITSFDSLGEHPSLITFDPQTGYGYLSNYFVDREKPREKRTVVLSDTQILTQLIRGNGQSPEVQIYNPVDGRMYLGHRPGDPELGEELGGVLTIISGTEIVTTTFLGHEELYSIFRIVVHEKTGAMYLLDPTNQLIYWDGKEDIRYLNLWQQGLRVVRDLAIDETNGWAYVASWNGNPSHIGVVDKDQLLTTIPVGYDPYAVAVDKAHNYVYVANRLDGSLSVIRESQVITTLSTQGWGPSYITVDEERGYIYVSNADSHSIAVFGFETPEPPLLFLPNVNR
jgi:DNA-binding beta-propeller fold protein YncE